MLVPATTNYLVPAPYAAYQVSWDVEAIRHLEIIVKFLTSIGENGQFNVGQIRLPLVIHRHIVAPIQE
jgi:hypothetical protein